MEKWISFGELICADPSREKEFNDFYDNVHVPNVLKAPGFVAATRYTIKEPMNGRGRYLTMRMGMRRFTRLTNAFSKKLENHMLAVALHFMHYNFARPHKTLANPYPRTPAMAAGISNHIWIIEEIVALAD